MNFVFKFDPDPKFDPKNAFFNFFKLVILPVLLSDFKCSTVCEANRIYRIFTHHFPNAYFLAKIEYFLNFNHQYG